MAHRAPIHEAITRIAGLRQRLGEGTLPADMVLFADLREIEAALAKPARPKNAGDLLTEARTLVTTDRNQTHGALIPTFERIAALWSAYIGKRDLTADPLAADEVCDLMEILKIARREGGAFNPDDYIDGAGYAACAYACRLDGEQVA